MPERGLDDELYELWQAGSPERHARLDALFRERVYAHDADGCEAALAAVVAAGGEGDPLLTLCRGIMATEITRDWGAAEAYFHAVLEQDETVRSLHARALMELGYLHRFQGRYAEALRDLARSCALAEAKGDVLTLAKALMNLGIAYTEGHIQGALPAGALDDALACQSRSKHILHGLGETDLELRTWNNMGITYKVMGRHEEAREAYGQALALTSPEQRFVRAMLTNNMAEVAEERGELAQAEEDFRAALAIFREMDDDYEVADALLNLGRVQERRGSIAEALHSYREAIAAVESTRARLKAEEARAGFLGTRLELYERVVALSLAQPGGEALAFEMIERAKARVFIELLADRPLRPPQAVPERLLRRERSLRDALAHLYSMGAHPGGVDPLALRATKLETELEELYRQMRRLDAEYAASRTVDPLSLGEVQARLPLGAALLEYFESRGELGCFIITRTAVRAFILLGARDALTRYLARIDRGEQADTSELSATLLAAIEPYLASYEDLYIVPHGPLHYVPLHALGTAGPLLESHRMVYAPSASILLGSHTGHDQRQGSRRPGCLALGYNGANLHYAELEARHVAAISGGVAYTGAAANAATLSDQGAAFSSLHLACHGTFNSQAPLASGLLLADGKLDAMTILQTLRLRSDLVVLSACDTGQAGILRGDELMGLARAILYAGARAVLVSLWPVDDLATAILMDAFYRARAVLAEPDSGFPQPDSGLPQADSGLPQPDNGLAQPDSGLPQPDSGLPPGPAGAAEALRQAQLALQSMSADEALAAAQRLQLPVAAADGESSPWTDMSLAYLHATAGNTDTAQHLVARARGSLAPADVATLDPRLTRWTRPGWTPGPQPYAHPYFWAAFALICGSVTA